MIRLEDVLKTSWRGLEDVLKTSWRRLEDVQPRRIYWSSPGRLEDVLKTSSEDEHERRLQDFFIKTNVCWELFKKRDSNAGVFLRILPNFQEHLLWRTSANGCFGKRGIDLPLMRFWSVPSRYMEISTFSSLDLFIRVLC